MIKQILDTDRNKSANLLVQVQIGLLGIVSVLATLSTFWTWNHDSVTYTLIQSVIYDFPVSIGFRFDIISKLLLSMITLLGLLISKYSAAYMRGEKRQNYFHKYLFFALISSSLLVVSSNLLMLFLMWVTTSFFLHKLLVYYGERPAAVRAARKKFIVSRLGDVALLLAIALTYRAFDTLEFEKLFSIANSASVGSEPDHYLGLIGFLFAFGAMTKSVQFPFHFWLPETMETPTPVSALMHAGIINAGGFLMIRLSPILQHAPYAHVLLTFIGASTAVFGALVMITQNDIKKKLAYSTISQMGMMMFSCGLGAYSLALFHILAHSFYKAYAFLSTGMQVEESKKVSFKATSASKLHLAIATLFGLGMIIFGITMGKASILAYFTYGAVLILGFLQNRGKFSSGYTFRQGIPRLTGVLLIAFLVFVSIEYFLGNQLEILVPTLYQSDASSFYFGVMSVSVYLIFAAGAWLGAYLAKPNSPFVKTVYFYFWNGGYFSVYSDVLLDRIYGNSQFKFTQNQIESQEHANA